MIHLGRVRVPILGIALALPAAVRAAREAGRSHRDPKSPGAERVTAGEVLTTIGAFTGALGEGALPAILRANGLTGDAR